MTTAAALPDVQPPAGTEPDIWEHSHPTPYRVVFGVTRGISGRDDVLVGTTAIQFADGQLDDGRRLEPPQVFVEANNDRGLTGPQARQLAASILEAADEVDGWVNR